METENNTIFLQRSRIVRRKYKNNPIIPCMNRTCTPRNHRLRDRVCSTEYMYNIYIYIKENGHRLRACEANIKQIFRQMPRQLYTENPIFYFIPLWPSHPPFFFNVSSFSPPPRGLSFSPFVSPISNDGNALPLSLSFSVFYFVWPSKSTANHRAFVVCSQRTKGIKFLKMLIGRIAMSLHRWTMILGRTLMETIFFHRSNLCSRIRGKNHQSSSIVIERKKSIR